MQLVFKRML